VQENKRIIPFLMIACHWQSVNKRPTMKNTGANIQ
jgi:hypothetical protein